MSPQHAEYSRVAQQIKVWPVEWQQRLAEELHQSLCTGLAALSGDWTEAKNARRCELIDKEIEAGLNAADRFELQQLQQQAIAYRDRVAPLPLEAALRLHQELLAKQRQNHG